MTTLRAALLVVFSAAASPALSSETLYQRPPDVVAQFVEAKPNPWVFPAPDRRVVALVTTRSFPSIAELSEPELRLAGLRVNPKNRSLSRRNYSQALALLEVRAATPTPRAVTGLPDNARLGDLRWSPDGKHLAFTITAADRITLWVADVSTAVASQVSPISLVGTGSAPCNWLPDSKGFICLTVATDVPPSPAVVTVPKGPVVQENDGAKRPARTNPNLLTGPNDEAQFEYFLTSQVSRLMLDGTRAALGQPGLFLGATPSPSGSFLLVERTARPFSYTVDLSRFPLKTEVWKLDGAVVQTLADLPLAENVTVDFDSVRTGRRDLEWRADAPATVCWAEALDQGDASAPAPLRDAYACLAAPFTGKPTVLAQLAARFRQVEWGTGSLALITEGWWKDRKTRTWVVSPEAGKKPKLLWDRSSEDRYSDPGRPVMRSTAAGTLVLQVTSKGQLLLRGQGASPKGDQPFFDRLDLAAGKTERLWQSAGETFASVTAVLDGDGAEVLLARESVRSPPQLFVYPIAAPKNERQLTHFALPVPQLANVTKQLIHWKRPDGQELSGMLYMPGGFRPGTDAPLPVLVWVYPSEFKSAAAAAQVSGSIYEYAYPWWGGPLFALTQGFAVVDDPSFAIVGEGTREPNDTYVEQLRGDAAGLIDEVVRLGVGDRERFAVGGHSYGAFTTVNLLAHSDLFRTGIARSGAYNRTLTPFGFQAEERTFWQAPDTYLAMSPFRFADRIDEPLLLIHGAADDNPGTYTIPSDRLFAAMQGLGGRVRYVSLPAEAHGYRAKESVLHVLWEQVQWLEDKVKNAKPRAPPSR
jgi:dipeptidyl aminopeptidase/acylaminoacyl peptidase